MAIKCIQIMVCHPTHDLESMVIKLLTSKVTSSFVHLWRRWFSCRFSKILRTSAVFPAIQYYSMEVKKLRLKIGQLNVSATIYECWASLAHKKSNNGNNHSFWKDKTIELDFQWTSEPWLASWLSMLLISASSWCNHPTWIRTQRWRISAQQLGWLFGIPCSIATLLKRLQSTWATLTILLVFLRISGAFVSNLGILPNPGGWLPVVSPYILY
jgi:hypothetical protein